MRTRSLVAALTAVASLGLSLGLGGCVSRANWASYSQLAGSEAAPTQRDELERRRSAALAGDDVEALLGYLAYLWQFDWEFRQWLDKAEFGKSSKLPAELADFDRKQYTKEALAAWAAVRPAELPGSMERLPLLRADFYAAALAGGCRDTQLAMGPLMVFAAEEPNGLELMSQRDFAVLAAECAKAEDRLELACRAGADLLANLEEPEYTDLDGDMWPDPSLRVNYLTIWSRQCSRQMSDEERAVVAAYNQMREPWFAEHYPEEHAAWVEEQIRLAEEAARRAEEARRRQAELDAQRAAAQAGPASSSGSAPAGPVSVNLYSACPSTVTLFFGDRPGGSGTTRTHSSNSSTNYSLSPGESIWIMANGQAVGSYSGSSGWSRVQINSSCTGFEPR